MSSRKVAELSSSILKPLSLLKRPFTCRRHYDNPTSGYCRGNCRITQIFLAAMENLNHRWRFVTCFIVVVSGIFQTSSSHQCDLQSIPFFKEIGFALVGHVIDTRSHVQPYDCLWSCKANPRCFSVNIERVRTNKTTLKRVQDNRYFWSSVILVSTGRHGNCKFDVTLR